MINMENREAIIKSINIDRANLEYIAVSGKINGSLFVSLNKAMQEYADQQTKALTDEIEKLNKDYSILNDQFVKSKEWNLEIVYSNKFKDKEIEELKKMKQKAVDILCEADEEREKLQSRISELENGNEMVNYILEIDWLTTIEFCDKYNVPRPVFTGQVESSVNEILRIDAVKHRMFVEKAKQLNKANKPKTN